MLTVPFSQGQRSPQAALQAGFAWSFFTCLTWMGARCSSVPWARNWCEAHHCLGTWWVKRARKHILFARSRQGGSPHALQGAAVNQLHVFLGKQQPVAVSAEIPVQHHKMQHSLHVNSYKLCCTLGSGSSTRYHMMVTVVRHPQHRLWVEWDARLYSGVTPQSWSPLGTQAMQQKNTIIFLKGVLFYRNFLSISSPCGTIQA